MTNSRLVGSRLEPVDLATLSEGSGMGMFLWNQSTGALISHLSAAGPAEIEPQKPQKLS